MQTTVHQKLATLSYTYLETEYVKQSDSGCLGNWGLENSLPYL